MPQQASPAPRGVFGAPAHQKRVVVLILLVSLVVLAVVASLFLGGRAMSTAQVWAALCGRGASADATVVWSLRVPRTAIAICVGLALGLAGALAQGHTNNPLADPGLLGVSAGAALAVLLGRLLLPAGATGNTLAALAGALVTALLVLGVAEHRSRRLGNHLGLVLIGAAVSTGLGALTTALILLDPQSLDGFRFWAIGSVAGRGFAELLAIAPFLLLGIALSAANATALNDLALGEEVAVSLGRHVRRSRVVGLLAISLLTGAAVASAGPLAFLGLTVTHMARALIGGDYRWLLPAAGLAGAALLTFSDVLGRVVVRPAELQVGVVLAFLGSPLLIVLIRWQRLESSS
ncbi:MAG: FecCD family ABC transporter permease [Angustibacter sp.]